MAEVQLEHGYLRIANRLAEAVLAAPFTGVQMRVLLALVRLTYGWRRRTVKLTERQLAGYAGMAAGPDVNRPGGTFRQALHTLVAEGVILRVDGAQGSRLSTFAIQKDYAKWGNFAVAEARLSSTWDARPTADDAALRSAQQVAEATPDYRSTEDPTWPKTGPSIEEATWPKTGQNMAQTEANSAKTTWPEGGPLHGLRAGHVDAPNSIFDETLQSWKDRKDSSSYVVKDLCTNTSNNNTASESHAAADEKARSDDHELTQQYAIKLSTAANAGITARWGEQLNPLKYVTGLQLAEKLRAANVSIDVARLTIDSVCRSSKNERPPKSLSYFEQPILEAHASNEQRALNKADPGVTGAQRGGTPRPISDVMDSGKVQRDAQLHTDYDTAKRAAGIAWGSDPANAERYRAIVGAATEKHQLTIKMPWGQRARDSQVVLDCADASGFPPFERWAEQHAHPPPRDPPNASNGNK